MNSEDIRRRAVSIGRTFRWFWGGDGVCVVWVALCARLRKGIGAWVVVESERIEKRSLRPTTLI